MKTLLLPVIPPPHTSFGKHRFNSDLSRFSLNLSGLNSPSPRPSLGSPYLSPPMSGSSPPTDPLTSPPSGSRRRKRSESQPHAAVEASVAPGATLEPGSSGRAGGQLGERYQDPRNVHSSPSFPFGRGVVGEVGRTSIGHRALPAPVTTTQEQPPPPLQRSQTGQIRRTKAHVASACVNCKKKHLRCDQKRPCLRCVQSGKEDSCVDVQHKKRGRPPLRPGDSPSSTFGPGPRQPQQSHPPYLSPTEDPALRGQRALLRPIRPGAGTQSPGSGDAGHVPRYPQPYPAWQTSPTSTAATASPAYSFTSAPTRPFSAAPSMPDPSYYPPAYGPSSGGYAPMDVPRSYPQQTSYFPQTQPFQFPPFSQPQHPYGGGYQPTTRSPSRPPIGELAGRETSRYNPGFPGPQLPPLRSGAAEQAQQQAQHQAQQLRPEQFQGIPQTRQQQAQHPPEAPPRLGTRQREEEEEGDPGERASKRRRGMKIGEILGER